MVIREHKPDRREGRVLAEYGSAHVRELDTPAGPVFLQKHCPPALLERLKAADGLRALTRLPEREHALLLGLANNPACHLSLAYTPADEIVGQVTVVPAENWWEGLDNISEIAVEVSAGWRRFGLARQLLTLASQREDWEAQIVIAMGLCWHWDLEGLGLHRLRYRDVVKQLFAPHGFQEYLTSEENIQMDRANIFLVRIGSQVGEETSWRFIQRLLQSTTLPGLGGDL